VHVNYYFLVSLIGVTAYALAAGARPERVGVVAYAVSAAVTYAILESHRSHRWQQVEAGIFVVDVVTFLFFVLLALRSNRFWPIWASAFLGLGVLGHVARWAAGGAEVFWYAYAVSLTIWSYPIMAVIALGTWNHQRRHAGLDTRRSVHR
jgi:hypothetical protein